MAAPHQPGLIDTNVVIDLTRQHPLALAFITPLTAVRPPDVSAVSVMELMRGCRNKQDLATLRSFLGGFQVHHITPAVSVAAVGLIESFTLSHGLDMPDALIAATALDLGLTLYTLNVRHFQMIPGLSFLRPY
jgi:predicted nucleic acid-binding protein